MPVDKFGRMSDAKTKDTGVSLTYSNNNYIRRDGWRNRYERKFYNRLTQSRR